MSCRPVLSSAGAATADLFFDETMASGDQMKDIWHWCMPLKSMLQGYANANFEQEEVVNYAHCLEWVSLNHTAFFLFFLPM